MKQIEDFKSLIELVTTYNTEEKCSQYIALKRWGDKPICPHCGSIDKVYAFSDKIYYKCGSCRKKFTVRVGTIFQDSKIPLTKWFASIYLFACRSKGVSSLQLSKDLQITQKSAWHMLHRLRYGMSNPNFKDKLEGVVEADETYIGGKQKNRHQSKQQGFIGRGGEDKEVVFGAIERKGDVFVKHVKTAKKEVIQPIIIANVKEFARVITDEWYGYNGLDKEKFYHSTIQHKLKKYVVGDIHTNTIEGFWSILKRNLYGIYHIASKKHLQKYLEEVAYRFNNRDISDSARFNKVLKQSNIGTLTYEELTADIILETTKEKVKRTRKISDKPKTEPNWERIKKLVLQEKLNEK